MSADTFHGLGSTLAAIQASIEKRCKQYLDNDDLILATSLDQRYKNSLFSESDGNTSISSIKEKLLASMQQRKEAIRCSDSEVYNQGYASSSESEAAAAQHETKDASASKEDFDSFDFNSCFDMIIAEAAEEKSVIDIVHSSKSPRKRHSSSDETLEIELNVFHKFPLHPKDDDPVSWWAINKTSLPKLSSMATKYLSAPPSSVESERLFSVGGNIYTPHRNKLKPEAGEQLMFSNYNLRVFKFKYSN